MATRPSVSEGPVRFHLDTQDEELGGTEMAALGGKSDEVKVKVQSFGETEFGITPEDLENMHIAAQVAKVKQYGGVEAYAAALKSDIKNGLSAQEVNAEGTSYHARVDTFGTNVHAKRPLKTFFELCLETLSDPLLIVLMIAGAISVGLGSAVHPADGWYEGVSIWLAVILVTLVSSTNNWSQQNSFAEMEEDTEKQVENVTLLRSGELVQMHPDLVLVGDVVKLTAGRFIPADGLMIGRSTIMVNESRMTGESADVKKDAEDPFLHSGTEVRNGECMMLVTAVGPRSAYGRILASLSEEPEPTPLQVKLERVATIIGYFGVVTAIATLIVLIGYWGHDIRSNDKSVGNTELQDLLKIALVCVTIVVVAVPEGLPLAVTLALAFSMKKMMKDNIMIRKLDACETMGNVSTICSDKTGTLTQNRMKVVSSWWLGVQYDSGNVSRTDLSRAPLLNSTLIDGVLMNSQAWVAQQDENRSLQPEEWHWREGNATEVALMSMLVRADVDIRGLRQMYTENKCVFKVFPFDSVQKRSSVIINLNAVEAINAAGGNLPAQPASGDVLNGRARQYFKGAAEVMVENASAIMEADGKIHDLSDREKSQLKEMVHRLTRRGLRALAFTFVDLTKEDLAHLDDLLNGREEVKSEDPLDEHHGPALSDPTGRKNVLLGWVGIQDPLRPETYRAVRTCQRAGVVVRMVTGDALDTAKYIARECGILTSDNHVSMIGSEFRTLMSEGHEAEAEEIIPRLRVLARSLPQDKQKLVQWLKEHGEVVAATGDGTNDAPALNTANVGIAMNLTGTAVCKAAARIWILDDSLSSIAQSILWGRSVFDSIRRFLQFQLTVNMVALILSFIGAVTNYPLPLTTVQLLWVNLIMDTLGALALATDDPDPILLQRKPYQLRANILSHVMMRNIAIQSVIQLAILFFLLYGADKIFPELVLKERQHFTLVFNTFVFLQLFNMVCSRKVNLEVNVFHGIFDNAYFIWIWFICAGMQALMVEVFGPFASTTGQTWQMWLLAIGLGVVALPFGILGRMWKGFDYTGGEVVPHPIAFEGAKLSDPRYSLKRIDLSRLGSKMRRDSKSKLDDHMPLAENHEALSDDVTLDENGQLKHKGGASLLSLSLSQPQTGLSSSQTAASGSGRRPESTDPVVMPAMSGSAARRSTDGTGAAISGSARRPDAPATSGSLRRSTDGGIAASSGSARRSRGSSNADNALAPPAAAAQPQGDNPNLPAPQVRAASSSYRRSN